jgi:hypothetical protein
MKDLIGKAIFLLVLFAGCSQTETKTDIFASIPIEKTKHFIDSVQHNIRLAAGNNFTALPQLKPNQHYYDERNFFDSTNHLRLYSVLERWDTGDIVTNYYYYKTALINVSNRISTVHLMQRSNYYFRNDHLFDSQEDGPLTRMATDTLLSRGYRYFSIKRLIGDTTYRKYFGIQTYPPNSIIELAN